MLNDEAANIGSAAFFTEVKGATAADVSLTTTVGHLESGNSAGMIARAGAAGANLSFYFAGLSYISGHLSYVISRNLIGSSGIGTVLASASAASITGTLNFTVQGSSLYLTQNGSLVVETIDTAIAAAGGMGLGGDGFGTTFTEFGANTDGIPATSLPFIDSFTRAASPSLGGSWMNVAGWLTLSGNSATPLAGIAVSDAVLKGISAANVSVTADVTITEPEASAWIAARYTGLGDTNMYAGGVVKVGSAGKAYIDKNVNGVWTGLATADVASASGTLELDVDGNLLILFFNGQEVLELNDASIAGAGAVGMRLTPGATLTNFQVSALAPTAASFPYSDNFDRANSPLLGGSWINQLGWYEVENDTAVNQPASSVALETVDGISVADVVISANIVVSGADSCQGVVGRYSGPGDENMLVAEICEAANGSFTAALYRNISGTWVSLGSAPVLSGTGTLVFGLQGSLLSLTYQGSLIMAVQDTGVMAAGTVGLRSSGAGSITKFSANAP